MAQRTPKEMAAVLDKIAEQIGPLSNWSDGALESFNDWLSDTSLAVEHEWVKRDDVSEADS
jgi:hypothetical protein